MTDAGPILCFGNSHMIAIRLAHRLAVQDGSTPDDMAFVNLSADPYALKPWRDATGPGIDPALKAAVHAEVERVAPRAILLLAGGNEHNIFAMFRHPDAPEPLDFVMPGDDGGIAAGHRAMSVALVRAEVDLLMARVNLPFMEWVGGIAPCPVMLGTPPPPITDADHLRAYPGVFAERIEKLQLSPALFRHKVWKLDVAIRRELADRIGACIFIPPPEVFDDAGLGLGPAFRGKDPTHGNVDYGKLILKRIRKTLDASAPQKEAIQ